MSTHISLPTLMFCDQCEQTAHGSGCTDLGICGKDPDVESAQKLLLYGVKGMAAYKAHARRLGKTDAIVEAFIEEALFATMTNVNFDLDSLVEMALTCGRMNLRTMQLLDQGHREVLGPPGPIEVHEGLQDGPGILVTGHDLLDLKHILDQAIGTPIKVYTHGEMLPGHMYPTLGRHPNLAGHYGGAWQLQRQEFEAFAGPIVATSNCVLIPKAKQSYGERLYTTRCTGIPGTRRIKDDDFRPVLSHALSLGALKAGNRTTSTIGFHHSTILGMADELIDATKQGRIRHFFVIGGCDGAESGRNYYSKFAASTPNDSLILTLGCGKYRIRDYDYGTVAGLPRLLDMGQCNDAYGAIQVALALANAFECSVNDLPLTMVISWFEQKAVAVLLSLLSLGIKGIRLGPKLPAFVSPNVLALLQKRFDLRPTESNVERDLVAAMTT